MTEENIINVINLKDGDIVLGNWKNKDQNRSYYKALGDRDITNIKDSESKDKAILKKTQEWLLAYSVFNGTGFLKGNTVEETFTKIEDLDILEATKLGQAFNDYAEAMVESIKKK